MAVQRLAVLVDAKW